MTGRVARHRRKTDVFAHESEELTDRLKDKIDNSLDEWMKHPKVQYPSSKLLSNTLGIQR